MVSIHSYLRTLKLRQANVNSLFKNKNKCKLSSYNLNNNSICFLADTRITQDRFNYINERFNISDRFFSTISITDKDHHCRAGASIIFPCNYLSKIVDVCYDNNHFCPRYIFVTAINADGTKITYGSVYLPANGKAFDKIKIIDQIEHQLSTIELRHYSSNQCFNLILAGDFNLHLDRLNKSTVGKRLMCVMSHFNVIDMVLEFSMCPDNFPSYLGNHKNAQPTRIDGIFISRQFLQLLNLSSSVKFSHDPTFFESDHYPVCIDFIITKNDIIEDIYRRGDDTFMDSKELLSKLDKIVRDTLILTCPNNLYYGGNLSRSVIECFSDEELDYSFIKSNCRKDFPFFEVFYKIIDNICKAQNDYKSDFFNKQHKEEKSLKNALFKILKKQHKTKNDIIQLRKVTNTLQNNKNQALQRQARSCGLKSNAFGETMSRFFLLQKSIKKSRLRISDFQLDNGTFVNKPYDIAMGLNSAYKKVFNADDHYSKGDLANFLGPCGLKNMGKIKYALKIAVFASQSSQC